MSVIMLRGQNTVEYITKLMLDDGPPKSFGKRRYMNSPGRCMVCMGEPEREFTLIKHHVSYFPEKIAFVHFECHRQIHDGKMPSLIQYADGDSRRFYGLKKLEGMN
jgi:hypothetical protein